MVDAKTQYKSLNPDPAKITALSGEIHRAFAAFGRHGRLPRNNDAAGYGQAPPEASLTLGTAGLSEFLGVPEPPEDLSLNPERLDEAVNFLRLSLDDRGRAVAALESEKKRLNLERGGWSAELADLKSKRSEAEAGLRKRAGRVAGLRTKITDLEKELEPELAGLERELREHQDYFKRFENTPGLETPDGAIWARRKELMLEAGLRLDRVKAGLHRKRAELYEKKSELLQCRLSVDGICSGIVILGEREKNASREVARIDGQLSDLKYKLQDLRQTRKNIECAGGLWNELRRELDVFPLASQKLREKIAGRVGQDWAEPLARTAALRAGAEEFAREKERRLGALDAWGKAVEAVLEEWERLSENVQGLSRELDQAVLEVDGAGEKTGDEIRRFSGRVEEALTRSRDLRARGKTAAGELETGLKETQSFFQAASANYQELTSTASSAAAEVRALAAWSRGAGRLVEKLNDQIGQTWVAAPRLIGPSVYVFDCLLRAALDSCRARQVLDESKNSLASIHDGLVVPPGLKPNGFERTRGEALRRLENLAAALGRLDVFERLPRQLDILEKAASGARRLKTLEKDHQKSLENLRRLAEDKEKLSGLLASSKKRLGVLSRERDRLLTDLDQAGGRVRELSGKLRDEAWPLAASLGMALRESHLQARDLAAREREKDEKLDALTALTAELEAERDKARAVSAGLAQVLTLNNAWDRKKDGLFLKEKKRLSAQAAAAAEQARTLERLLKDQKSRGARELAVYKRNLAALNARLAVLEGEKDEAEAVAQKLAEELGLMTEARDSLAVELESRERDLARRVDEARDRSDELARRLKQVERDFQKNRAELRKVEMSFAEASKARDENAGTAALLTRALTLLAQENGRRQRLLLDDRGRLIKIAEASRAEIRRLNRELEEEEARRLDHMNLVRRQAVEIQGQRDQLAQLYPLIGYFMERIELWTGPGEGEGKVLEIEPGTEYQTALVQALALENEALKERLKASLEQRSGLRFENDHLARANQALKDHLNELKPVLSFFWQSWASAASELAGAAFRERALFQKHESLKKESRAREQVLEKLSLELSRSEKMLAAAKDSLNHSDARVVELEEERRALEKALAQAGARAEAWRLEAGDKGGRLETAEHRDRIKTGRAEAALAGLTLLAEEARKVIDVLRARSDAKSERIAALEAGLAEEKKKVAELERGQDRLGLMFWVMAQTGTDPDAVKALVRLSREKGFRDAASIAALRLQDLTSAGVRYMGGEKFRKAAGRAARRGLMSLLLAGTMIAAAPQEPSKATAPRTELELAPDMAEMLNKPAVSIAGSGAGAFFHPEIGRLFDVGFLAPWEAARGIDEVERRVSGQLDALASENGLGREAFDGLIRRLYKPDQPASLTRIKDRTRALDVLKSHFPLMASAFQGLVPESAAASGLYRLAGLTTPGECRFWDRLFADYLAQETGPAEALDMVLANAEQSLKMRNAPGIEYAGRLKPAPELEKMDLSGFVRVIKPYIMANIKSYASNRVNMVIDGSDNLEEYSDRLARDIYFSARIFQTPVTLMVSIAHQESYFANVLGDHSMSASPFQIYKPTKPYIIKSMSRKGLPSPGVPARLQDHLTLATYMAAFHISELMEKASASWGRDKKTICDLDRVAYLYNGGERYPGAVYRKKLRLMRYLAKAGRIDQRKKNGSES